MFDWVKTMQKKFDNFVFIILEGYYKTPKHRFQTTLETKSEYTWTLET